MTYKLIVLDITNPNIPKVDKAFTSYSDAEAYRSKIEGGCRIHTYAIRSVEEIENRLAERKTLAEQNTHNHKRQTFTSDGDVEYYD